MVFVDTLPVCVGDVVGVICLRSIEMLLWNLYHLEENGSRIHPKSEENLAREGGGQARAYPSTVPKHMSKNKMLDQTTQSSN